MNPLEQTRQKYPKQIVNVNGVPVEFVRTGGAGRAVLMLPGAQGTAESFCQQLIAFGGQRDIISINYPGLEQVESVVDLVVELASHLRVEHFDIVGTSLGGYVAQWIAAMHPARVGRAVIGNSFHDPRAVQGPEKLSALQNKTAEQLKLEVLERLIASPESDFKRLMLDLVGLRQTASELRNRMLLVQRAAVMRAAVPASIPVLLVECDNDPLIPPAVREAIRTHYAGASVVQISGGGHYPYYVKADEYNQAIGSFLA